MPDLVTIEHLEARYHLPASRRQDRRRLDDLLAEVVDGGALEGALESALAERGIGAEEEVCLRRIEVPVRLHLRRGDGEAVQQWGRALAEAIGLGLDRGGPELVRYPSRIWALVDLARGVASGDLRRAWAWRQLGLGTLSAGASNEEACRQLVSILEREPQRIIPVLGAVAASGQLAALTRRLPVEAWKRWAAAAGTAAGLDPIRLEGVVEGVGETGKGPSSPGLDRRAARAVEASGFGRTAFDQGLMGHPRAGRALAILALLDSDRALLLRPSQEVAMAVSAAALCLAGTPESERSRSNGANTAGPALGTLAGPRRMDGIPDDPRGEGSGDTTGSTAAGKGLDRASNAPGAHRGAKDADLTSDGGNSTLDLGLRRQRGETRYAGLLFLVRLLGEIGFPEEMTQGPLSEERSLPWWLYRLGLELLSAVGVGEATEGRALREDPVARAFAGLGPEEAVPRMGKRLQGREIRALRRWRRLLVEAARELLGSGDPTWLGLAETAVLARLVRRRGTIFADPGWIEVRLSMDEVSFGVRRAGLDLDPGFVPWLGVVLRFLYRRGGTG